MIVSSVGVSCQSMGACGWSQRCLEVVEKQVGLSELHGSSGDREIPGDVLGALPLGGSKAQGYSGHVQNLRGACGVGESHGGRGRNKKER